MKKILGTIAAAILATQAHAATFKNGYAGCDTKAALSEFISAANKNDYRQMNALLGTSCAAVGGFEYSVVSLGMTKTQVRVYVGSRSVLLWVPTAATR